MSIPNMEFVWKVDSAHVSVVDENEVAPEIQFDEDYDYDGENDEDYENGDNEDAAEPVPDANLSNNPFANWLGAIAAKSVDATAPRSLPPMPGIATPKPAPPPAVVAATPATTNGGYAVPIVMAPPASSLPAPEGEPLAFLSPSDFVAGFPRAGSEEPASSVQKQCSKTSEDRQ